MNKSGGKKSSFPEQFDRTHQAGLPVFFPCLLSPPRGEIHTMQQESRGGDGGKWKEKRIQTLFLETVENPPQLHHMTFPK